MQNNLVFFYIISVSKMGGPSRTFCHAKEASGVTDTAPKVQATKPRNVAACWEEDPPQEEVQEQIAPVYTTRGWSFPQKEMVNVAMTTPPAGPLGYILHHLQKSPMPWYLQNGLPLNRLLLPDEHPLQQEVVDLWRRILDHLSKARKEGRTIGSKEGPESPLSMALEDALSREINPEDWVGMAEDFLRQALRDIPAMALALQRDLSLHPLLLPPEQPLAQQVDVLWEKILQHRRGAKSTGDPIGTFFGPNQYSLWQATEVALRRGRITAKEWAAMEEADLVEGYFHREEEEGLQDGEEEDDAAVDPAY